MDGSAGDFPSCGDAHFTGLAQMSELFNMANYACASFFEEVIYGKRDC